MSTSQTGDWCIFYRKLEEPTVWHTMKLWRKEGVLVSAKTYDEVYKCRRFKEAFDLAKNFITDEPLKYEASVNRVCRELGTSLHMTIK